MTNAEPREIPVLSAEPGEIPVFGIDLGTTNSCIARLSADSGRPQVMENSENELVTPSVVFFAAADEPIVGRLARNMASTRPDAFCREVKREMSREPQNVRPLVFHDKTMLPEQISAFILRKVVKDALELDGLPGDAHVKAVITVPAYFGAIGKNATLQAGKLANIDVLYVAPEPVAAAFGYVHDRISEPQTLLVYDLGGGTFDVTVVETDGKRAKVIALDGERLLGGVDWDQDIVDWFRHQVQEKDGIDLPTDDASLNLKLAEAAEGAKIALSRMKKTDMTAEYKGRSHHFTLTVEQFEELTAPRLATTVAKTKAVIEAAREKGVAKIDQLLLVGGSSRMPAVERELRKLTELAPVMRNPERVVAEGAAVLARLVADGAFAVDLTGQPAGETAAEGRIVTMLTPKSLGLGVYNAKLDRDIVDYLIPKNSELPATKTKVFGLERDSQRDIHLKVYEERGLESEDPAQNVLLHESPIELPPNMRAGSPIEVTFRVDDSGILHLFLKDLALGQSWEVKIDQFRKASDEDVLRLRSTLENIV